MHSAQKFFRAVLVLIPLVFAAPIFADEADDQVPDVTDRVARISFLRGDVQIRRSGAKDWERAVLNLPLVEGDEIATEPNGRAEIQLNSYTHVRLAESTYLKFSILRDEGVAISIPRGSLSLRAVEFDKDRSYLEFDMPKTTVSVEKPGFYRLDAGPDASTEIAVAASDGGQARVYTDSSGFTVKNGRRATIFIEGQFAGEWQTADASKFADEFETWSLERDAVVAKLLRNAYFDRYYDRDIYGAEDLTDYGEWIHTSRYGYVWRPYRTATSSYSNWSPYRYGHWRWVGAYGWVWVNDEPWGWATYHYGRWVWDSGYWVWSPYSYYRPHRSWWYPALVVVSVFNNNICWYPLPYSYGYYNYNYYYYSHYRRRHRDHGNNNWNNHQANNNQPPPGGVPQPSPNPGGGYPVIYSGHSKWRPGMIPPGAVVTVPSSEFGRDRRIGNIASADVAKQVLGQDPADGRVPPALPTLDDLNGKLSQSIRVAKQPSIATEAAVRIGAADRRDGAPLDQELRRSRMLGDREPVRQPVITPEIGTTTESGETTRKTGAVSRPQPRPTTVDREPTIAPPTREVPVERDRSRDSRDREPVRQPSYEPPQREKTREPIRQPSYEPPTKSSPPPRSEPPASRPEPPRRSDPPPQKSDPPPSKQEPPKSDPPAAKKRDGAS